MPNHTIINATTSMLDMSPLCDLTGQRLTLRAKESRDVDDKTFNDDIVQRVVHAGWLSSKPQGIQVMAAMDPDETSTSDIPTTQEPADEIDVRQVPTPESTSSKPADETSVLQIPAPESMNSEPEISIETPITPEKPLVEPPTPTTSKSGKRR
jgi:hypothetical protein